MSNKAKKPDFFAIGFRNGQLYCETTYPTADAFQKLAEQASEDESRSDQPLVLYKLVPVAESFVETKTVVRKLT